VSSDTSRLVLASRVSEAKMAEVERLASGTPLAKELHYFHVPRMLVLKQSSAGGGPQTAPHQTLGKVAVLCAGTADLSVAEEAAHFAEFCGAEVRT
jgi:NCAIR mutase (PurE)-related protein